MQQNNSGFQYTAEKGEAQLTGFAGLPLYIDLAKRAGFWQYIEQTLQTKQRGWQDVELIMALILLNLAGGESISDIDRLEADGGLRKLVRRMRKYGLSAQAKKQLGKRWRGTKLRGLPSNAAIHRFLLAFHSPEEEEKREANKAFIPQANDNLQALGQLNQALLASVQQYNPQTTATLDQDATLTYTHKRNALYSYKKQKAYQPFNTYWAEHGVLLHSEFRDGNVPAGFEQLRLLKTSIDRLPETVTQVLLRSDSAAYQEEILRFCAEGQSSRGIINYAIAARVSAGFKAAAQEVADEDWHTVYQYDENGMQIATSQQWAEVCFVPDWLAKTKSKGTYRYLAIREAMKPKASGKAIDTANLPFQTIEENQTTYKLFGIVTNLDLPGNEVITWHRERCGRSEQVHDTQKNGLAGGRMPSNKFGVNAAWWLIMTLAFNLNRLLQITALPESLKNSQMKALRFHLIQLPGRVLKHARKWCLRVAHDACDRLREISRKIANIKPPPLVLDTS